MGVVDRGFALGRVRHRLDGACRHNNRPSDHANDCAPARRDGAATASSPDDAYESARHGGQTKRDEHHSDGGLVDGRIGQGPGHGSCPLGFRRAPWPNEAERPIHQNLGSRRPRGRAAVRPGTRGRQSPPVLLPPTSQGCWWPALARHLAVEEAAYVRDQAADRPGHGVDRSRPSRVAPQGLLLELLIAPEFRLNVIEQLRHPSQLEVLELLRESAT